MIKNPLRKQRRSRLPAKTRRRRLKQKLILFLKFLAIIVLLFGLSWFIFSDFLKISHISCQLDQKACQPRHLQLLDYYRAHHLLLIKPSRIENQLLDQDPLLSSAQVSPRLPDTLKVELTSQQSTLTVGLFSFIAPSSSPTATPALGVVSEATAQATISAQPTPSFSPLVLTQRRTLNSAQPQTKTLTASGELLSTTEDHQPQAYLLSPAKSSDLKAFYQLYQELILSGFNPDLFWLWQDYAVLFLSPGLYVKFPLSDQPAQFVTTLQQIRSQSTINLNRVIIDLRFNQPVVSNY